MEITVAVCFDCNANELRDERVSLAGVRQNNLGNDEVRHQIETATNRRKSARFVAEARLRFPPRPILEILRPVKHIYLFARHPIIEDKLLWLDTQEKFSVNHGKVLDKYVCLETQDPASVRLSSRRW